MVEPRPTDNLDIRHAREVLDADHYDLEKVKDRILEYLAVRKLNPDSHGPILCFVGPPGVGKTSLGRSIARALGRKFERISVGGVRDEAEIRGHRRTYIGAMPGTIIRALRDAGSRNPVFMIDEIDKMGADFRGDPPSAMLEVLDPAQNDTFRDHYLDLPFDLSEVLFIATANILDTIPAPLLDRMEVIQLAGYTLDEKLHIASRYLVPRQLARTGCKAAQVAFTDAALRRDHRGVHPRGRGRGTSSARSAPSAASSRARSPRAGAEGQASRSRPSAPASCSAGAGSSPRHGGGPRTRASPPGSPGRRSAARCCSSRRPRCRAPGKLTITGQLGDVMRESAQAALSWVRGHCARARPRARRDDWFATHDIHIHVPAGAVPKDGPSAGVAMATALSSLVSRPAGLATTSR